MLQIKQILWTLRHFGKHFNVGKDNIFKGKGLESLNCYCFSLLLNFRDSDSVSLIYLHIHSFEQLHKILFRKPASVLGMGILFSRTGVKMSNKT